MKYTLNFVLQSISKINLRRKCHVEPARMDTVRTGGGNICFRNSNRPFDFAQDDKKVFLRWLVVSFCFSCINVSSATFTAQGMAAGTFDWNDGATWGNSTPGTVGVDYPGAADIVNIPGGEIIEIPAGYAASCAQLNLNSDQSCSGADLTFISSTSSLNVSGNVTIHPWDGISACGGSGNAFATVTISGGTCTIGGNLTATGYDDGDLFYHGTIVTGAGTLTVAGDIALTNSGTGLATINMNTVGSTLNVGAGFTLGTLLNGTGTKGTINYTGSSAQTILSGITYYNLTTSGGGLKTLNGNTLVKGTLTMTSGNIDLATYTMTLHNAADYSTLVYTSGWAYNGSFERWLEGIGIPIGNVKGLFPVGSSTHYRPLWVAYDDNIASAAVESLGYMGSLIVSHNAVYPSTYNVASHVDATWGGGTTLQGVSQSYWSITQANGYQWDTDLRYGGQGFGTNTLTDLNASLSGSVVGTHTVTTGTTTEPYVNRTAVPQASLNNNFRIGSKDLVQSPLPVSLLSFDALAIENAVDIRWITATEINNDYFTIQRSKDAVNWENIKQVEGAGNSTLVINYSEMDLSPYPGTSFYRLRQTDFNGMFSYSHIESVNFKGIEIIQAYPVPASDKIGLAINSSYDTDFKIELYNSIGQMLFAENEFCKKGINNFSVDIDKYANGNYLIKIQTTDNKEIYSDKLLFLISK